MYKDANINLSVIDAVELGYDRDSYSTSQAHLSTVWIANELRMYVAITAKTVYPAKSEPYFKWLFINDLSKESLKMVNKSQKIIFDWH